MKVSLNHIRFYKDVYHWSGDPASEGIDVLVAKIGAQLGAVEAISPVADRYQGALIVRVVACEKHPGADRLHVCRIDDGGKAERVERDENGHVQVVCGAPNVHAGMLAVWLPPGTTVPSTYYDIDSFVLEAREIRGQKSNGMLASPKELGLSDSHEGILELDDPEEKELQPGVTFIDAFNLRDDHIIDMENKMFTHRPDCFGMMGVAREVAGIQGQAFKSPDWYRPDAPLETSKDQLQVAVRNELPQLVKRFVAVPMSNVTVKASPVWLQLALSKLGVRPINNVVDLTNYYMVLTGQPLHAYDYDKVAALSEANHPVIAIRYPYEDEKITLLGGKEVAPTPQTIMIATDKQAIGIGGVMGGADTEVDENTKNIIIECAHFDMYSVRRTSMALGLFTDAVTRFTKGQSPLQNIAVIARIVADVERFTSGSLAGELVDDNHLSDDIRERGSIHPPVTLTPDFVNERLGLALSAEEIRTLLTNVEFEVQQEGDSLTVKAPFWRTDITIPEDIVEEVGRLYGYDHLPLELPQRSAMPAPKDPMFSLQYRIREQLTLAGANEVLNYSFVHGDLLDKAAQNREHAFQVANALSPDLQYYRLGITPSLLANVHPNIKAGHDSFALFELGKVHAKGVLDDEGLPRELARVALVFAADAKTAQAQYDGAPYYQARKYAVDLLAHFGLMNEIRFAKFDDIRPLLSQHKAMEQMLQPYEPNRAAAVMRGDRLVGVVGEYRANVTRAFKLPAFAAGFELFLSSFSDVASLSSYVQLPRFPKVEQDICLRVPADLPYSELSQFVWTHLDQNRPDQTYHSLSPLDIYQREEDREHKQITLRLTIASYDRTLTDDEVNSLLDQVAEAAQQKFSATRV